MKKPENWLRNQVFDHGLAATAYVKVEDWNRANGEKQYDVDGELSVWSGNQTLTICADLEKAEEFLAIFTEYIRRLRQAHTWVNSQK